MRKFIPGLTEPSAATRPRARPDAPLWDHLPRSERDLPQLRDELAHYEVCTGARDPETAAYYRDLAKRLRAVITQLENACVHA